MVFTNITPFPRTLTPVTNISPLTYRDAATFLEYLETIKQWLNETLVPDSNAMIANAIAEFQQGIANAEATILNANADNLLLVNQAIEFINTNVANINALMVTEQAANKLYVDTETAEARTYVDDSIQFINNKTGQAQIQRVSLVAPYTLDIDPLWPSNHPIDVVFTQDETGNRAVTLGVDIDGEIDLNTAPNSVTEISLIPVGDGTWKVFQLSTVYEKIVSPEAYGAKGNGIADDTAAMQAALNAGNVKLSSGKTYLITATLTVADGRNILGEGISSVVRYTGAGALFLLVNQRNIKFRNFRVNTVSDTAIAFDLSNSFRCSWHQMFIDGQWIGAVATYNNTVGIKFRDNSGDNRIHDCDINNFGVAIAAQSIQNYVSACDLGTNRKAIHATVGGGLSIIGGTILGHKDYSTHFIHTEGLCNQFWITNTWMEGADIGIELSAPDGPVGFQMVGGKIAAHTTNIKIGAAKLPVFIGVRLSSNGGTVPTPMTIDPAVAGGVVIGMLADAAFDLDPAIFPAGWTFLGRDKVRLPANIYGNSKWFGGVEFAPTAIDKTAIIARNATGTTANVAEFYKGSTMMGRIDNFGNNFAPNFSAPSFLMENTVALPAAGTGERGKIRYVQENFGGGDKAYICIRDSTGAYVWKQLTLA